MCYVSNHARFDGTNQLAVAVDTELERAFIAKTFFKMVIFVKVQ
jgi:hypothetical protein